jgi:two-component system, OmpR family, response regulator CpxR
MNPSIQVETGDVLLIDDDVSLCRMLEGYLSRHGWKTRVAHRASTGLAAALEMRSGLIILDVMLPEFDGFELLRRLRKEADVYVLLLTARGEEIDRIIGLELGADDYLAKPFNPRELLARMRAIVRRGPRRLAQAPEVQFSIADFVVDPGARSITFRSRPLELTDLEFELLRLFLARPTEILGRAELVENAFDRPFHPADRSLDMHVLRLRRKLEKLEGFHGEIRTVRSNGYMFLLEAIMER